MRLLTLPASLSLLAFISALPTPQADKPLPLLIWHGLGDRFDAGGLTSTGDLAEEVNPGTYVYYLRTDDDGGNDRYNTFFGNATTYLEAACEAIHNEPGLRRDGDDGVLRVDALGFSQGGQFLRGLIERCEGLSVRSLVTFGSQHNGIAEFQECGTFDLLCKGATALVKGNVWTDYIQNKVIPAQYYRPLNDTTGKPKEGYLEHSNFLADINNEREEKNANYAKKIAALESFVMFVFEDDETVVPKESGWFAEVNATSGEVTPLRERKIYKEDWIGLKKLDKKGGLKFKTTSGGHMELDDKTLREAFATYFGAEHKDGKALKETPLMVDQDSDLHWDNLHEQMKEDLCDDVENSASEWLDEESLGCAARRAQAEWEAKSWWEKQVASWNESMERWLEDDDHRPMDLPRESL